MSRSITIQIILTLIGCAVLERIVARWRTRFVGGALTAASVCGVAVFFLFVWWPNLATQLAAFLGVGRGVDALMYLAVAGCVYAILRILMRLEHQEHLITKLVSEIALLRHSHEHTHDHPHA